MVKVVLFFALVGVAAAALRGENDAIKYRRGSSDNATAYYIQMVYGDEICEANPAIVNPTYCSVGDHYEVGGACLLSSYIYCSGCEVVQKDDNTLQAIYYNPETTADSSCTCDFLREDAAAHPNHTSTSDIPINGCDHFGPESAVASTTVKECKDYPDTSQCT